MANIILAVIQDTLKDLRNDLLDHVQECQEFDQDDSETFAASITCFNKLEQRSKECSVICQEIFTRILVDNKQNIGLQERIDDRAQLSSMRVLNDNIEERTAPKPSLQWAHLSTPLVENTRPSLAITPPIYEPIQPKSPWTTESPSRFDLGASIGTAPRQISREISPSSMTDEPGPLIGRDIVSSRLSANEDFLERRRQSKILFQKQLRNSITSIEEYRVSQAYSDNSIFQSPILGQSPMLGAPSEKRKAGGLLGNSPPIMADVRSPVSPMEGRTRTSGSGYETLMTRQRSQGHASRTSRGSDASSILPDRSQRTDSVASQDSIFGLRSAAPLSPPHSEHRSSGNEKWETLATTLQVLDFGKDVEPGLEVMGSVDHENGLMLASEVFSQQIPTPTPSLRSVKHSIRHDSSFYKFGGFCDGAKAMLRGESGFKIVKRPSVNATSLHNDES